MIFFYVQMGLKYILVIKYYSKVIDFIEISKVLLIIFIIELLDMNLL